MKKIIILLLLSSSLIAQKYQKIERVIDGDTYEAESGQRFRLVGVDTPEHKGSNVSNEQPFAKEATAYLKDLIEGKTVKVTYKGIDIYGRKLVTITIGKKNLSDLIVRNGYGWNTGKFVSAQKVAKNKKRGLWIQNEPISPMDWKVIYSTRK